MECEIDKSDISLVDWLISPSGRKLCVVCRAIYFEEERKSKEIMNRNIAERLEERKK